jgi:hypothetical protein
MKRRKLINIRKRKNRNKKGEETDLSRRRMMQRGPEDVVGE